MACGNLMFYAIYDFPLYWGNNSVCLQVYELADLHEQYCKPQITLYRLFPLKWRNVIYCLHSELQEFVRKEWFLRSNVILKCWIFVIKIYFFKKSKVSVLWINSFLTDTRDAAAVCLLKEEYLDHKHKEVTCSAVRWMLRACLYISNFFRVKSLVWNVGYSVYNCYTRACVLTPAGKPACYLCVHRITETFILRCSWWCSGWSRSL